MGIGTGTGKGAPVGHLCATAAPVVGAVLLVVFPMSGTAQSCRENQLMHWMSRSASTKARRETEEGERANYMLMNYFKMSLDLDKKYIILCSFMRQFSKFMRQFTKFLQPQADLCKSFKILFPLTKKSLPNFLLY